MSKSDIDLISLIEHDLGPGKRSGRWTLFHCPFPGHAHGDRKPSLAVTNGSGDRGAFWKCFACDRHGNAIGWLMEYESISYKDALAALQIPGRETNRSPREPYIQQPDIPPGETWQARAWKLIERAEAALWDERGKGALSWLNDRGLNDFTIAGARLGFIPLKFMNNPAVWGSPHQNPEPMTIPEGILIPGLIGKTIWYLKVRPLHPREGQKYMHIRGGRQALYLADTIADGLPTVFCEGELDALLLLQEARELVNVITLASATGDLNLASWGIYLMRVSRFILAHDTDEVGEKGAAKLAWLHDTKRLQIPPLSPGAKDLTDYFKAGGDLRALMQSALTD